MNIINHGVIHIHGDIHIHYHYKKPNKQQLKRDDIATRFTKLGKDIFTINELIANGKKEEAIKIIDDLQKIQYELMELYEEDVKNNIISEECYLTEVNNFKLIYNKMTELKQQII